MENDKLNTLRSLYQRLEKTKIPPFTGNDELDEWIENLIEIDAMIAGLTCSFLGGEKISPKQITDTGSLTTSLKNLETNTNINFYSLEQYKNYLELLCNLQKELFNLTKR